MKINIGLPVIGLTGHARDTASPECLASGMNDMFIKPINSEILEQIINQYINNK